MTSRKRKSQPPHPFAYDGLDRLIHERARLGVLTSLVAHPKGLLFGDLKRLCGLTDGNLSQHLQVLEGAKLVEICKGHKHNRPQTICRITPQGRKRYLDYLAVLEQVVLDAAAAVKADSHSKTVRVPVRG
jgi:DNA-binding MarR family transcriptional regulator